jgi:sugar-specific transcriptional regulator TrmB
MKKNILAWLISSGLDEQRAALYLAALSKGEATAGELAKALKIGRTAIYDNLRVLEERGYIKTIRQGKRKLFVPLDPKELYRRFEHQKEQLKDLLPELLALHVDVGSLPSVKAFTGPYAAREVFEDILDMTKKEYVYFSLPDVASLTIDRAFIAKWVDRRVKKGIVSRSLRVKTKSTVKDPAFDSEERYLRQIRYLPTYVDLKSEIYVYDDNIGVISTKKEGAAFIIRSHDLAYSLRQLFDFLWGISLKS